MIDGVIKTNARTIKWQGFRGGEAGAVVYYESDPNSELPLRNIPVKEGVIPVMDPNYETKTYGLYDCANTKLRNSFVKKKRGYLFFMTRYNGTNPDFEGKVLLTGYYRVKSSADVQKLHLRHLESSSCINDRTCQALLGTEAVFLSLEDSYKLTAVALKSIGYEKKITRMSKILLDDEMVQKLLKKFKGKDNIIEQYIEETHDLMPTVE